MPLSTIHAAHRWLRDSERHPLMDHLGTFYWSLANSFPSRWREINLLPPEVFWRLPGGDCDCAYIYRTRANAVGAAAQAAARALNEGWEPEEY